MKKLYISLCVFLSIFLVLFSVLYFSYVLLLPPVMNSVKANSVFEKIIYTKTGLELKTNNLRIKTFKNLAFYIYADKLQLNRNDKKVFDAENIKIMVFPFVNQKSKIIVDNIYIDKKGFNNFFSKKDTKQNAINIDFLDRILIKNIFIAYDIQTKINIKDVNIEYNKQLNKYQTVFNSKIESSLLKNNILIINDKNIQFDSKSLIIDNIKVYFGKESLIINGIIYPQKRLREINLSGNNLPVEDIQSSVLYFLKQKNPNKNFMENFKDYSGTADINLKFSNNGVDGTVFMKSLSARTVLYNVPVKFNNFTGYFNGNEINAEAYGYLGYEKVFADFHLSEYKKEKRKIYGRVHSLVSNKSVEEYVPDFNVEGNVNATVFYKIENSIPKIIYVAKLDENCNLEYKNLSLGLTDKSRRLFVRTEKYPDKLYIKSYDYSLQDSSDVIKILTGDALFEKTNGKFKPSYVTLKTETSAPVSVAGSFGKRLEGGFFSGDLKYDFKKEILTGSFNLVNSKHKDFLIKTAEITADEKIAVISSTGTYYNSPYNCYINMDNRFRDLIRVHNIELFLDEYVIKKKIIKNNKKTRINIPQKVKELDYIIEQGSIKLNKIKYNKIIVENINVYGDLKNDIVTFSLTDAHFAKGSLNAEGNFNINDKNAIIDFSADNIDSDSVATMIFNLPGEIEGTAKAALHANINTETRDLKANASFFIKDGYLPKIGNTEFLLKLSRKERKPLRIKLSDIINIDISKAKSLASDINGSFDMDDWELNDIKLFSKQKYLSFFIEGNYDIENEYADLKLWGKYNKTARNKVKILFVPLSLIMNIVFKEEKTMHLYNNKIKKIPPITAQENEIEFFRVRMKGNLNKNDVKVELKSIR